MGKYEKKPHKTEYEDIQNVFQKRDRKRAERHGAQQGAAQDYPDVPGFLNEPRRIRGDADYSVESMRQVHEGQAVYDDRLEYRESSSVHSQAQPVYGQNSYPQQPVYGQNPYSQQPVYVQEPYYGQPGPYDKPRRKKRRKKHRFLRFLLKLAALLLALLILAGVGSVLFSKMPESDQPLGPRKDGCCTILLCGTDEEGTRTDTMLLLYLDRNAKKARLLSLPRDTMVNRDNPVPKLNGAYGANGLGKKGMNVLMDYVKDLVGFRPDGYMLIDLDCFADLVDAMGGVTYDVPMDMEYNDPTQDLYINLKQGLQKLSGEEAMWLVRFRSGYAMADLERVRVQRDFLGAAIRQWKSLTRLPRAPYAALLLIKNTTTDLSYRNLCWTALTLVRCVTEGLESDTLPGEPKYVNGGAYYVEDRQAAAELVNEKYNPYETEITTDDLHPYGY